MLLSSHQLWKEHQSGPHRENVSWQKPEVCGYKGAGDGIGSGMVRWLPISDLLFCFGVF